jgi:predicted dehydrogenase
MNYALIGCGRISINHLKAAIENDLNIVAICDINAEQAEHVLAMNRLHKKNIKKYSSYKEMIAKENIDLISIATKSGLHAAIAKDCINAGIHLIVEKPLALSLNDIDEIIELSKKNNIKVSICHQNRLNPSVQSVRELIESNRLGKISHGTVHILWNRDEEYFKQAPWRGTWEYDGGLLMNQCIHDIDIFRWLMGGEIEEVFAYTARRIHDYIETEDVALALIKFKNGAIGTIEGTINVYPSNLEETFYIFGQAGTVKLAGKSLTKIEIYDLKDEKSEKKIKDIACISSSKLCSYGHNAIFEDTIDAIINDRNPSIDTKAARDAIELIFAIHQSALENKPIKLPLSGCSLNDFKGMFN